MKIDLHMHSVYSDGDETPETLAKRCAALHVEVAALTDHDTVGGVAEFLRTAASLGMEAVSGIELSSLKHKEVHILGYKVNYLDPGFIGELSRIQEMRARRNSEILRLLSRHNIFITEEDIAGQTRSSVGRKHIAAAMVRKGYVFNLDEAFSRWLGHGKRAYVPAFRLKPHEAISLIKRYGGAAVLAHPLKLNLPAEELKKTIKELKDCGLDGIEAYYVSHTTRESELLQEYADELDLGVTCGSDYHGSGRIAALGEVENVLTRDGLRKLF